jgi:hypothetical protein
VDYTNNREKKLQYAAEKRVSQAKLEDRPYNPRKENQKEKKYQESEEQYEEYEEEYEEQYDQTENRQEFIDNERISK